MKPRLLDLFCGAGGAAVGYQRAGFDVVGVDIKPQPNYPFYFIQSDAMELLKYHGVFTWAFDAIHTSPPCQAYSDLQKQSKRKYPNLIPELRNLLIGSGLPYIIENVQGAPLKNTVMLCGTMFNELRVLRHRLFESNFFIEQPEHEQQHPLVFTHDKRKAHYGKLDQNTSYVQVTGGGNATVANKLDAMGIDWMTGAEINEAIPPAYTEYIGLYLMKHLKKEKNFG